MATDFLVKQGRVMGGVRLVTDADVAHQTDLTNIRETGTTASQAISAGTYFYLNNVLVRAKADIANGATFTLNTNYEVVTAGALNEIITRGSVSVTADGVKTYNQLLNALFAITDMAKITNDSVFVFNYNDANHIKAYHHITEYSNNYLAYARLSASASGTRATEFYLETASSKYQISTGSTRSDSSTQVPNSGWSFEIFY